MVMLPVVETGHVSDAVLLQVVTLEGHITEEEWDHMQSCLHCQARFDQMHSDEVLDAPLPAGLQRIVDWIRGRYNVDLSPKS